MVFLSWPKIHMFTLKIHITMWISWHYGFSSQESIGPCGISTWASGFPGCAIMFLEHPRGHVEFPRDHVTFMQVFFGLNLIFWSLFLQECLPNEHIRFKVSTSDLWSLSYTVGVYHTWTTSETWTLILSQVWTILYTWLQAVVAIDHAKAGELVEEVCELLLVGGWNKILSIHNPATRDLTLEVLASFDFNHYFMDFHSRDMIRFHTFGQYHSMSLINFSITLGLCDRDYIYTKEYTQLPFDFQARVTPSHVFQELCEGC